MKEVDMASLLYGLEACPLVKSELFSRFRYKQIFHVPNK